jgi:23S rRNA pseudouridine1911/1915/1917 synthase
MQDNQSDEFYDQRIIKVDPGQSLLRIDKFLMDRLDSVSRNWVQNAIRSGSITVDGQSVKPNHKVKPNQEISVLVPKRSSEDTAVVPQNIPLDIRYEDDDVVVVYKPPGMVVHPGIGNPDHTLVNALAYHFDRDRLPVMQGNERDQVGLVHRIDKNTSGLLLVAKTDYAMTHLAKQFFDHSIERRYNAIVWGDPEPAEGTIQGYIARHPTQRQKRAVFPEDEEHGKWAVTHYKVLESMYYVSLVECQLETGRTHQIRVHFQHIGHPLFNDHIYGGDRIVKGTVFSKYKSFVDNTFNVLPRQALHARSLGFVHPRTGQKMHFDTELPEDMQSALDRWRRYLAGRSAGTGQDETSLL